MNIRFRLGCGHWSRIYRGVNDRDVDVIRKIGTVFCKKCQGRASIESVRQLKETRSSTK